MRGRTKRNGPDRTKVLIVIAGVFAAIIVVKLFQLQVLSHGTYAALAEGQHNIYEKLFPTRGKILVSDKTGTALFPLATNEPLTLIYANPAHVTGNPEEIARRLAPILGLGPDVIVEHLTKEHDTYEPLQHGVRRPDVEKIKALDIPGIGFAAEQSRLYPEGRSGSHIVGFLGYDGDQRKGQYGIEGAFEKELAGEVGHLAAQRDAAGGWIAIGSNAIVPARNGDNVVLTIDRAIQNEACTKLDEAVLKHGADGGSVVVMNPTTGAVLAMCGNPDFDPNTYSDVTDPSDYLNPAIFRQYEPGSVMKSITMSAALDLGKVTPATTYTDEGFVKYGGFTIRNSDGKAHGVQTMTQVLEASLNTGAIFAMQQMGPVPFAKYLDRFGFGTKTGIELPGEQAGDISSLDLGKEIYAATASYGQGITVTPLQLTSAFAAIANRGVLLKPFIVRTLQHPDGSTTETQPVKLRSVITPQTATTISAMLVNVVRNGHGKKAAVPGYYVAGKTGTAQIPRKDGPGYEEGVTIGTFAGFAPVEKPVFAMAVRIDRPRDVQFAESSAAPLFGEVAAFILNYYDVTPNVVSNQQ